MKYKLHFAMLLLLGVAPGFCPAIYAVADPAEPRGMITLTQAFALAEDRHSELNSARLEAQAVGGRVTRASAFQNPALSVEAENFGGRDEQKGFDSAEYTAQLEQALELGGKRGKRIRVAAAERQLAGFDLDSIRMDVRAETSRRFIGLLGAQSGVALAREALALAEDVVKAVAARVDAGKVSPMELEKARIEMVRKRLAIDQADGSLATARVRLAAQWGSVDPVFDGVAGDLPAVPAVIPLPDLMSRLSGNPDVARWAIENERSQAVLALERAARVPDLTVAAGIRRFNDTGSDAFVAGISVPLPVFDRNQGGIREAEFMLARTEQQQRAVKVKVAADLAAAHQALATAVNEASALKDEVLPRVKTVFDSVQSGYSQGKYTYLEVLDAQRTLVELQVEYIETLISAHTAWADLERIVGWQSPVRKQD